MSAESALLTTWSLYLIRDKDNRLYTGITTDVSRRFAQHQAGKGARNLRGRAPLTLHWHTEIGDHSQALKAEYRLKQWPKSRKERLPQHPEWIENLISV
ncbi:GIY-YIG nuclease family protein [Tolumonas osonensis]|uniref:Putative endonuclease n=1 Tax=Tolumonas osonensis TaxID=675874 RepID=A0A841GGF4_9GAMM|nr:putative endonuclease [Tolumonas osonensis]